MISSALTNAGADNFADRGVVPADIPGFDAKVEFVGGALGITLNGKPFGSLGISSLFLRNMSDQDIGDMMNRSNFKLNHITFTLGEDRLYLPTLNHGSTWIGEDTYDWGPLDRKLERVKRLAPDTRIVLQIDLDGAKWWTRKYPHAAADVEKGIPDYLHEQWIADSGRALRELVSHLQSGPYRDMVIAYTLFNGPSLDCNWRPNLTTETNLRLFREFLRKRYRNDVRALRESWQMPEVDFASAVPTLDRDPRLPDTYPLLHAPAEQRRMDDSRRFRNFVWSEVILNFAAEIKAATHRRALVGARVGNLMFGYWGWDDQGGFGQYGDVGSENVNRLLESPDIDYFDQWANYFGRTLGSGDSGGAVMPPQGLLKYNKLILLQNDIPTHINNEPGYGATSGLEETLSMQRRVFAHSMINGMYPYLWQMSSSFNVPGMLPEWRNMQAVFEKSMKVSRKTVSAVAFVVDRNLHDYLGKDLEVRYPTRGIPLIDYARLEWGRAGVGFDMVHLDELDELDDYSVYVFYHTLRLDDDAIRKIHRKLARNRAVGVFVWADGIIDGNDRFSLANMEKLTGMKIVETRQPVKWASRPVGDLKEKIPFAPDDVVGLNAHAELGGHRYDQFVYPPSLRVAGGQSAELARSVESDEVTLALKDWGRFKTIYSASPILTPQVLRYIVGLTPAFKYLDSDDAIHLNESFVEVHTRKERREILLKFPEPTALYEVFTHREFPESDSHRIAVEGASTYLFFRGSKEEFDAL